MKKEDSKKAFEKEAVFKVPKIKGYPMIRIEKDCDFRVCQEKCVSNFLITC